MGTTPPLGRSRDSRFAGMTNAYKKLNPSAADLFRSAHHQNNTSFGAEYATRHAKMKQKKQKMRCLAQVRQMSRRLSFFEVPESAIHLSFER
jgi:hypothetical protein